MEITITNSNNVEGLNKYIGDDIQIINIKHRDDLYSVQMVSQTDVYRAFAKSRKGAIGNVLKAIYKDFH